MTQQNKEIYGPWREFWSKFIKNKLALVGLTVFILLVFVAIFADFIAPYGMDDQNLQRAFLAPSEAFILGTDNFGRDIFSRIVYGSRISLIVGVISVGIALMVGSTIGIVAGFVGGLIDTVLMRFIDLLMSIPSILMAISIVAALGPSLRNVMIAVGISSIPSYARLTRSVVISLKELQFIEAAHAMGTGTFGIIARHIVPNSLAPIIVQATMGVAGAILSAAGLGFIGLGIQPPTPEWGAMLNAGRHYIRDYPHMITFPGIAIMITIFSLNLLGDGLRDALDPKLSE